MMPRLRQPRLLWAPMALMALQALSPLLAQGATPACPAASDLEPAMLVGTWQVEWSDGARQRGEAPWTLVLGPHPQ